MVEISSSGVLIARANRFLDSLAEPMNADEVVRNLQELERFKEEMARRGFNTPFVSMAQAKRAEDLGEEEVQDIKKQIRKMKEFANAKRFTLNRLRVAIAANKIAMRVLSRNMEILGSLPVGGNYIAQLIRHGEHAAHSYGVLLSVLSESEDEPESSVMITIEYKKDGKKVKERVRLLSAKNIAARVKRAYGENARVLSTEIRKAQSALIRSKSVRACVASAYAARASGQVAEEFDSKIRKNSKMAAYVEAMKRNGIADVSALEDDDKYFKIMEELEKQGLAQKAEEGYVLDENIIDDVEARRRELRGRAARIAAESLALDLFKYYMSTPIRKRESEPMFPSLTSTLTVKQVRMFTSLSRRLEVEDAGSLLLEKIDSERFSAGIKGELFGASLFSLRSRKSIEWCAEFFGIEEEELKEVRGKVEALLSGGKRAGRFMELVRDARNKGKQQGSAGGS